MENPKFNIKLSKKDLNECEAMAVQLSEKINSDINIAWIKATPIIGIIDPTRSVVIKPTSHTEVNYEEWVDIK